MPIPRDRDHTISHLNEAIEELQRIARELKSNPSYDAVDFELNITHAYHHLNYAWNSRRLGGKRAWAARTKDFYRLRQMPKDIDFDP